MAHRWRIHFFGSCPCQRGVQHAFQFRDDSELQGGFELGTLMREPVHAVIFMSKVVFRIIAQQVLNLERNLVMLNVCKAAPRMPSN